MKKNLYFSKLFATVKKQSCFRNLLLIIPCFITLSVFSQNPLLLKSPFPAGSGRSIQKIVSTASGNAFFNTVDANTHFSDLWGLWTTDGTAAGTKKITLTSPPLPGGTNSFTASEATLLTSLGNGKVVFAGDNEEAMANFGLATVARQEPLYWINNNQIRQVFTDWQLLILLLSII